MLPYCPQVTGWEVEGRELKGFVQRSGTKSVVRVRLHPSWHRGPILRIHAIKPSLGVITVTQPLE